MLWERTVGRRVAVATRAEAIEKRIVDRETLCPGWWKTRGGRRRVVID
jgi:hypothetical protein